jgi:hypothetical protein
MTAIPQLTAQDTISVADSIPVYSYGNAAARRISAGNFAAFVQSQIEPNNGLATQYAAPTATGQTTIVSPPTQGASTWLEMTPLGAYAAGTITFPAAAVAIDGQEVLVTSTLAVTALTVNFLNASGVSAAVVGAPTTLAANGFFRMRFDAVYKLWIRVG